MGESMKDNDRWAHARVVPRFKTFQPASVEWGGTRRRAHILDVSARGARVHCDEPLAIGSSLALICNDFTVRGRIVWVKDQRFGVEFQGQLPDTHVRRIMEAA